MGADNQAEKIIDRIERMERMQAVIEAYEGELKWLRSKVLELDKLQAEIERLNIRIRQDADKALQHLNEIDRLNELVAALRQEKERLYIAVANRDRKP